jgi:hypothetical protein
MEVENTHPRTLSKKPGGKEGADIVEMKVGK